MFCYISNCTLVIGIEFIVFIKTSVKLLKISILNVLQSKRKQ